MSVPQYLTDLNLTLCPGAAAFSLLTGLDRRNGSRGACQSNPVTRELGGGLTRTVCVNRHIERRSGSSLHMCYHRKRLPLMAHGEEEHPRAPVGDPNSGGSGLPFAKPSHRADKYDICSRNPLKNVLIIGRCN